MSPGQPPIRRTLGWVLAGSLCLAALVAIVALVSGSFDDTDWRLIGTSLSFAVYSALAASGAALRAKEHPVARPLGGLTVVTAAVAWVLLLVLIWSEDAGDALARAWGVATIVALAGSHASIVLRGTRAGDPAAVSGLVVASMALGALDATAGILAVAGVYELEEDDPAVRLMAVTVVLLLLTTALPPILRRLRASPRAQDASPAWPVSRATALDRLVADVLAATDRIEASDDLEAVRAESRRLRERARLQRP